MKTQTKKDIKFAAGLLCIIASVIGFCITFHPAFIIMHLAGWVVIGQTQEAEEEVYRTTEYINHK